MNGIYFFCNMGALDHESNWIEAIHVCPTNSYVHVARGPCSPHSKLPQKQNLSLYLIDLFTTNPDINIFLKMFDVFLFYFWIDVSKHQDPTPNANEHTLNKLNSEVPTNALGLGSNRLTHTHYAYQQAPNISNVPMCAKSKYQVTYQSRFLTTLAPKLKSRMTTKKFFCLVIVSLIHREHFYFILTKMYSCYSLKKNPQKQIGNIIPECAFKLRKMCICYFMSLPLLIYSSRLFSPGRIFTRKSMNKYER